MVHGTGDRTYEFTYCRATVSSGSIIIIINILTIIDPEETVATMDDYQDNLFFLNVNIDNIIRFDHVP